MDYKTELQSDDDFDCSNSYNDNFSNNSSNNNNNNNSNTSNNFNTNQPNLANPNGLSKAELRKTNKPIMEKRRRARINHCLNELKSLILEAMKKDPARHTKLEKADILEMTVKHLQSVQRQQLNMAIQTDPSVIHKFKTGFVECAEEVNRYISQVEGIDPAVRQRLTNHLNNCANNLEQLGSMTNFSNAYRNNLTNNAAGIFGTTFNNTIGAQALPTNAPNMFPVLPQDFNNNTNQGAASIQMGGVQLIPSRLPSGEFALIMPNTATSATAPPTNPNQFLNNNTTLGTNPFTWPPAQNLNANQIPLTTEYQNTFQRMSAFTKPLVTSTPPQAASKVTQYSNLINGTNNFPYQQTNLNNSSFNQGSTTPTSAPANNLHQNTTATNSPPLSPISSVSSHGDDSILQNSSDFAHSRTTTPPLEQSLLQTIQQNTTQTSFSGVFSTPPPSSAESSFSSTSSGHISFNLQQEQVTSTSGVGNDLLNSSSASLKRSFTELTADSCDSSDYKTSAKKMATDMKRNGDCGEESDSMWRPW